MKAIQIPEDCMQSNSQHQLPESATMIMPFPSPPTVEELQFNHLLNSRRCHSRLILGKLRLDGSTLPSSSTSVSAFPPAKKSKAVSAFRRLDVKRLPSRSMSISKEKQLLWRKGYLTSCKAVLALHSKHRRYLTRSVTLIR